MQDEEVLGAFGRRGTLDGGDGPHHDGFVLLQGLLTLPLGEVPAQEGEDEAGDAYEEARAAAARRAAQQEQQGHSDGGSQKYQAQRSPGVGRQQIAHGVSPLLKEDLRDFVNAVLREAAGIVQVVAHVGVGRIQLEGALVPQDGLGDFAGLEIGVAQVVVQFAGHEPGASHFFPVPDGRCEVTFRIGRYSRVPEGIGVGFGGAGLGQRQR